MEYKGFVNTCSQIASNVTIGTSSAAYAVTFAPGKAINFEVHYETTQDIQRQFDKT